MPESILRQRSGPGDCFHRDLEYPVRLPVRIARHEMSRAVFPRLRFQLGGWGSRAIPVRMEYEFTTYDSRARSVPR